jgi:hypothetical protein
MNECGKFMVVGNKRVKQFTLEGPMRAQRVSRSLSPFMF